jgi:hypothetical protein
MLVDFWPVDDKATTDDSKVLSLSVSRVEQPWIPRERHRQGPTVKEVDRERIF